MADISQNNPTKYFIGGNLETSALLRLKGTGQPNIENGWQITEIENY